MISNGKMTDRELLERAAKAAGLEPELLQWDEERECVKYQFRSDVTEGHLWNSEPHYGDDVDALCAAAQRAIVELAAADY
jgi:hypothetical protein